MAQKTKKDPDDYFDLIRDYDPGTTAEQKTFSKHLADIQETYKNAKKNKKEHSHLRRDRLANVIRGLLTERAKNFDVEVEDEIIPYENEEIKEVDIEDELVPYENNQNDDEDDELQRLIDRLDDRFKREGANHYETRWNLALITRIEIKATTKNMRTKFQAAIDEANTTTIYLSDDNAKNKQARAAVFSFRFPHEIPVGNGVACGLPSIPKGHRFMSLDSTFDELADSNAYELSIYPSSLMPNIPPRFRMRKGQKKCSSCALYAYNGTENCSSSVLSFKEMTTLMKTTEKTQIFIKSQDGSLHSAMFVNAEDRLTACLVFFEDQKAQKQQQNTPLSDEWFSSKCILVLYHPIFYPQKHCIVLHPPHEKLPDVWCIRDPFRKDGSSVAIRKNHLSLLFAYADIILW